MKKLLIIATHGLGDLVMTAQALGDSYKKYKTYILVSTSIEAELVEAIYNDSINVIILREYLKIKFFGVIKLLFFLRFLNIDISLCQYGVAKNTYSLLVFFSRVKYRIGWGGLLGWLNNYNYKSLDTDHKVISQNLMFKKFLASTISNKLTIKSNYKEVTNFKKFDIIIGASSFEKEKHKRWPALKYATLINKILENNQELSIALVGSENEYNFLQNIVEIVNDKRLCNLAGLLNIENTLQIIKSSKVVIANCNAISHFGAAIGNKVIGLYGPTNYKITGAFGSEVCHLTNSIPCSPCYQRKYTSGCSNPSCMSSIEVDSVYLAFKNMINDKSKN